MAAQAPQTQNPHLGTFGVGQASNILKNQQTNGSATTGRKPVKATR
jgi:hypothetical protein